jgi:Fur family peroxide stress response transcriptional regulator
MKQMEIRERLKERGLRVTPQRVAVLTALMEHKNHPDADTLVRIVREQHPSIARGTIYHILDNLVQKGLVQKVQTEENKVRYDAVTEPHIHLYSHENNRIEDYFDEELFRLIEDYLQKKAIKGFRVDDVRIKFLGDFINED